METLAAFCGGIRPFLLSGLPGISSFWRRTYELPHIGGCYWKREINDQIARRYVLPPECKLLFFITLNIFLINSALISALENIWFAKRFEVSVVHSHANKQSC